MCPAATGHQERRAQAPMTEDEVSIAVEDVSEAGGIPSVLPGKFNETISVSGSAVVTLGLTSAVCGAYVEYHATRNGNTQWGKLEVMILADGSTVETGHEPRVPAGEPGIGVTMAGSILATNLRLTITADGSTGSTDIRGSFRTVEA